MEKMDEVKDKLKGFVKKINNPFVPSGKFRGEGHRLGGGEGSRLPSNATEDFGKLQKQRWDKERQHVQRSTGGSVDGSSLHKVTGSHGHGSAKTANILESAVPPLSNEGSTNCRNSTMVDSSDEAGTSIALQAQGLGSDACLGTDQNEFQTSTGFDPFASHIGSVASGRLNGELNMFQCPICGNWWKSESEINDHVEECLNKGTSPVINASPSNELNGNQSKAALGVFLSGGPSNDTLGVMIRILCNILNSPETEKYRKIRLSNPRIQESVGMALGGMELLQSVGFVLQTEGEEVWAVMRVPLAEQMDAIQFIATALEKEVAAASLLKDNENVKGAIFESATVSRKVDRQVRVFFAAPENLAAQMDLPDSFFQLSAAELRQEAIARKKKLEDSQLLVPRSFRDKKAAENRNRYKAAIVRIQFPDGVILQGMFLPWEKTTAIYEFVASSLRDPGTRFNLVAPVYLKNQIIPAFAIDATGKIPTLADVNLVPATLVKFQCAEEDSSTFTGLHPDLLIALEPLSSATLKAK